MKNNNTAKIGDLRFVTTAKNDLIAVKNDILN